VNAFLAKFFVNRGQTNERWELRPHALKPFYRALSHWCIFLVNPATYGWKDGTEPLPPINVKIHEVDLTPEQIALTMQASGKLIATDLGGIATRASYGQIAKGHYRGEYIPTNKPEFIRGLVNSWPDEATIIWCIYNEEQRLMASTFPDAVNIDGDTPLSERLIGIDGFKSGEKKTLISKSKILGFGLNLQVTTKMVFSGLQDSYEAYYQCVKRANRVGSKRALDVHIPITEIEQPMVETVLRKAKRVQEDTEEQEQLFKESGIHYE
jgi:superfamily II DNA or RNA helicase